jgi:4-hydroxy 2-oxovalerate aldolase
MTELKKRDSNYSAFGRWISYRADIKIMDCTIRDGGLMNKHQFSPEMVKAVYDAAVDGGIDYIELGYKASNKVFAPDQYGAWKFCEEDDLRRIVGDSESDLKLSIMADTERTDYHNDILPKEQSVADMVRVATYIHQIPTALDIVHDATDKGYETSINIMAISTVPEKELDEALELIAGSEVNTIYLVDSFGSLYSEQIQYLMGKYLRYANSTGKQVGIHAHNNQQLAFANTIEALILGANILDGSMAGLGRGAGNCPTESLLGFLHNPKFRLRPVLKCIHEEIEPLREELGWGYDIPYMITGLMNQHPRSAIEFNQSKDKGDTVKFFDQIVDLD